MYNLIKNIDRLHTTKLGVERIKRNLELVVDDFVDWCRTKIGQADEIIRKGKNWHVRVDSVVVTINAHSYTIITAHKTKGTEGEANMGVMLKESTVSEYPLLEDFLYNAIFLASSEEAPSRKIIYEPEIFIYINGFGNSTGDHRIVAEQDGKTVGMAWSRIISAYAHIDDKTPELAISVLPEYRGQGIGSVLMNRLFNLLREYGYSRTSLSVQKDNPAVRFYERIGYKITDEKFDHVGHEDYIMLKELSSDLARIPGIGVRMAGHLINAGYPDIESLKGQDPEEVYQKDCLFQGVKVDRCALYCYRLAVHYANNNGQLPPDKQNWWQWKD